MTKKHKARLCGHKVTQSGKPCRRRRPCPYHTKQKTAKRLKEKAAPGTKQTVGALRQEKLIQLRLQGKTVAEAGREAGYPDSVLKGKIYQIMDSPEYKARIAKHLEASNLNIAEVVGILFSYARGDIADFFPDDELLQRAKQVGISHLIKKIKRKPIIAGFDKKGEPVVAFEHELEIHDQKDAAKYLATAFRDSLPALNDKAPDFDAAVDRFVQRAEEAGLELTREEAIEELKPLFGQPVSNAVN